ncbi:putative flippase GtrA [Maribacter caenipelagi]|uniref:Putative flippase GtrA n=1 Tax=Maribacter caenipelagi TaxID=1447781 RepID=A0A4R7D3J5_9FLAO|nr:GtrA family protein [Maribacter caenipelagi]TDS13426.1 putative flippase GtrA [Maribacter caenipelagi]
MKIDLRKSAFLKFLVVGGFGTIINISFYTIFVKYGIHFIVASLLAFVIAVTSNYYFNSIWTFKNRAVHKTKLKKYFEFISISGLNLLTNLIILSISLWILNKNMSFGEFLSNNLSFLLEGDAVFYNKIISQVIGIGFATILNYLGNKFITFKEDPQNTFIKP